MTPSEAVRLHAAWLTSDVAAAFNESAYYPYTSLKYHVLLTAALLSEYRAGRSFDELFLAVGSGEATATDGGVEAALESGVVSPHRTVLWSPLVTLVVTSDPGDRPAARLGPGPARSFCGCMVAVDRPAVRDGRGTIEDGVGCAASTAPILVNGVAVHRGVRRVAWCA
ncbi:hypothetical protein [Halorubrum sp. CBA1125]|uniref:hypothetical protein n=1 Tax=Halorubrum sp. CBA1125 TaxID=2668072 RepID=UPI002AA2A7A9|nr:hypothetical protein [Halorubrum sp. CBA1125]